ncbi:carnosine N-methyltransferase-like [Anneissia japonica]|uniref:carnosine N-methyltransferase-like n=1 Tax=Anneissia japonica TaxID=1529436 RepID=UPI001425980E|nr:carnosine N-methyltransferase-like [Anneissia japonica]
MATTTDSGKLDKETVVEDEEALEKQHFLRIIHAYRNYRAYALDRVQRSEKSFNKLSDRHKKLLPAQLGHFNKIRIAIDTNYELILRILNSTDHMFVNKDMENTKDPRNTGKTISSYHMEKIYTTLKQFSRDWSSEGQQERDLCYKPIIEEVLSRLPIDKRHKKRGEPKKVLVPGAGLGRLAFEIAKLGYMCQGNEFSMIMLIAANFILNRSGGINSYTLYPWVHQYTNNKGSEDQVKAIKIPDICTQSLPQDANFSMAAGDFLEVYTEKDYWNCIATCYFIDTAHNILDYLDKIYEILKPGGYWINLGPLLYHFSDIPGENSIEVSYVELRRAITEIGFVILDEHTDAESTYTQNPRSMLQYKYHCVFFTCQKPRHSSNTKCS